MRAIVLFVASLLLIVSPWAIGETDDTYLYLNEHRSTSHSIEVWSSFQGDLLEIVASRFKHETGHELAIRQFSSTFELRSELLIAQLFGTYVPDLVWMPSDFLGLHDYMGLSAFPGGWVDKTLFEQRSIESLSLNGQVYGVPLSLGNHLMLYYDKRRVTKPASSWEALIAASQSANKPVIAIVANDAYFFSSFFSLHHATSPLVSFEFDRQATEQTLTFVRNLVEQGVIISECDHQCGRDKLVRGEVDYLIDGDWSLSHLPEFYVQSYLAIAPSLPTWQGKNMTSFSGGKVIAITQAALDDNRKRGVLKEFVELIQDPVFLVQLKREVYHVSAISALNTIEDGHTELERAIYEQYLLAQPMPIDPRLSIGWESLARTLQRVDEGMPIDEAALFFEEFFFKYQQRLK